MKNRNDAQMPYRVTYNQDCSHLFATLSKGKRKITSADVDRMVDEVAEGGAELMLINPNSQIGRVNYPSKVWQTFYDGRKDLDGWLIQMKHLAEQDCDYLKRALQRCRKKQIGAGVSIRMNDTHNTPWPDDPVHSDFYRNHPEWRISAPYRPDGPYATVHAMDYRRQEVRDYFMALIREIITDYKPDVLELDFMRWPLYFPLGTGRENSPILTAFIRDVRKAADRKMFLTARVPVTPAAALDRGLDVAAWAREQLVDGLVATAHFNTAWDIDFAAWRRVAGQHVRLYAGMESCAFSPEGSNRWVMGRDEHLMRGFAAANYAKGADGIAMFNFFCARPWTKKEPLFSAIRQMRNPARLRGKAKSYVLTAAAGYWHLGETDGPLQVPRLCPTRNPKAFHISIGDEPDGLTIEVEVVLDKIGKVSPDRFHLHINEKSAGHGRKIRPFPGIPKGKPIRAVIFQATSAIFRPGINTLVFRNDGPTVNVSALLVQIMEQNQLLRNP